MDPEQVYQEVLQEEQQKGTTPAAAEGRAKAARVRAEHGSPHPKEPKWWPGAQPHLEGDGAAPPEEAEVEEAAPEAPAEEPAAAEPPAEPAPAPAAETPGPQPPDLGDQAAPAAPAAEPQPAAATAPQPVAAAAAEARPTELPPDTRPSGVTHGTTTGTRLRPEDEVTTDAQFDAQQAVYQRRKIIDDLVASGVPAVAAADTGRRRSPTILLLYLLIPALAIGFLLGQQDSLGAGGGEGPTPPPDGGGGLTITAANVAFDTDTLELTAGEEETLTFVNDDASSVDHNVAIYEEEGGKDLFVGDVIPGGQETEYQVPALDKGSYYFQCDVHPGMNGEVVVE